MKTSVRPIMKKLFLLTLVLLFLLPGCKQGDDQTVSVYCLSKMDNGIGTKEYVYDETGNVLEYPNRSGGRTVCTYDENGNTLTQAYYLSSGVLGELISRTYDRNGNVLTEKITVDASLHEYSYTYDDKGNPCSVKEAYYSAGELLYEYVSSYTYYYNENDVLIQSVCITCQGNDPQFTEKEINIYDANGNLLTREIYSAGDDTTKFEWTYDSKGNCLSATEYRNGAVFSRKLHTYDDAGNLLTQQDDPEVGSDFIHRTEYTYDASGNKISFKEYSSFKGYREILRQHITYSYDEKGNLLEENQLSTSDGSVLSSTVWTYDKAGTMRSKTDTVPGIDVVKTWTYDKNGNLTTYEWSNQSATGREDYSYITFKLPTHLLEKVQLQQAALFEALTESAFD